MTKNKQLHFFFFFLHNVWTDVKFMGRMQLICLSHGTLDFLGNKMWPPWHKLPLGKSVLQMRLLTSLLVDFCSFAYMSCFGLGDTGPLHRARIDQDEGPADFLLRGLTECKTEWLPAGLWSPPAQLAPWKPPRASCQTQSDCVLKTGSQQCYIWLKIFKCLWPGRWSIQGPSCSLIPQEIKSRV